MPSVTDATTAHTTGQNHIDALLDTGPAWNYLQPGGNTLTYTFSVASGNEDNRTDVAAFNASQQANTRSMLAYITSVTGINFSETNDGTTALLHFAMNDIIGPTTAGLCSWHSSYGFTGENQLTRYSASAYVYLDSVEWGTQNLALAAGNNGYETLLHEMGHALGLKHPFEGDIRLPGASDTTANSVMSYTDSGGPYSTFRPYDLAALNWLYGGDGLAGNVGVNSLADGRYLTGSAAADTLTTASGDDILIGLGGNDVLDGGAGFDTAMVAANRANFTLTKSGSSFTLTDNTGALGVDTLSNIERITFADRTIDFDTGGLAAKAYRIYQAAFDRAPDAGGFGFWIYSLGVNPSIKDMANGFISSAEFINLYGANATNESIVTKLYSNVLHRAPDQGGYDFWVSVLNQGNPLSGVLADFSESPENKAQVVGVIQNGMEYAPFHV